MPQFSYRARYAQPENSAWPIAHFHRAASPFAASWDDARRSVVDLGKAFEAAARSANDAFVASGTGRWPQFFAGLKRDAANFYAAVCKFGGCGRGKWCAAANSASAGQAFDAG